MPTCPPAGVSPPGSRCAGMKFHGPNLRPACTVANTAGAQSDLVARTGPDALRRLSGVQRGRGRSGLRLGDEPRRHQRGPDHAGGRLTCRCAPSSASAGPAATRFGRPGAGRSWSWPPASCSRHARPTADGSAPATSSQATSGATGSAPVSAPVTVATQQVDGLGVVLTTADGQVLYLFLPDDQRSVTCTDVLCAGVLTGGGNADRRQTGRRRKIRHRAATPARPPMDLGRPPSCCKAFAISCVT